MAQHRDSQGVDRRCAHDSFWWRRSPTAAQEIYLLPADAAAQGGRSTPGPSIDLAGGADEARADGTVLACQPGGARCPWAHRGARGTAWTGSRGWGGRSATGSPMPRPGAEPSTPNSCACGGSRRDTFVQVTLNRPEDGDEPVLVAVLNDATELKSLEAQFVQSQKMQAIGQLAGGVAHDFNNLLTAIAGHCDLLCCATTRAIPITPTSSRSTRTPTAPRPRGQLLAFSRKQTMQARMIDLRDALSELTHLLNRLVGERSASPDHEPGLVPIRADRRQLEQVLMNLVVNARDAMPEGGTIRSRRSDASTSRCERDRAVVACGAICRSSGHRYRTRHPPDKLSKIFEPFWTTKRPGRAPGSACRRPTASSSRPAASSSPTASSAKAPSSRSISRPNGPDARRCRCRRPARGGLPAQTRGHGDPAAGRGRGVLCGPSRRGHCG